MSEMVLSSGHVVRHRRWFQTLFRPYIRRKLSRAFDGVHVTGLAEIRKLLDARPVILAANHCSWWDALVVVALDDLLRSESYCLMDADNLRKLPFFGWLGAVPLERSQPREALKDLRASAALVQRPNQAMWIFPQGRLLPPEVRPMQLHSGVSVLARESGAVVVPVSFRYVFREAPQPAAMVRFGAPLEPGLTGKRLLAALETSLVEGLDRATAFAVGEDDGFETVIGQTKDDEAGWLARALARLGRGQASPDRAEERQHA